MANRTILGVTVLLSTASVTSLALAADVGAGGTRNWGGMWIGFGAGYADGNYSGTGSSDVCMTSARTAGGSVTAYCEFSGGQSEVYAGAIASNGPNGASGDGVSRSDVKTTYSEATATGVVVNGDDNEGALAVASGDATPPGETTMKASANAGGGERNASSSASGNTDAGSTYTYTYTETVATNPPVDGYGAGEAVSVSNSRNGVYGGAGYATASSGNVSAEALAIGFGGLPTGNMSGTDGGLASEIHLRFDHQTESNWLFGAELDLSMPGSDGADDSTLTDISSFSESLAPGELTLKQSMHAETSALASARLRIGYAMGDYLVYGTGGAAFARFNATATTTGTFDGHQVSDTQDETGNAFGGVIGGGVSTFVADNAAVSLEGLYYHFDGEADFNNAGGKSSVSLDDAFSVMMKFSIRAD